MEEAGESGVETRGKSEERAARRLLGAKGHGCPEWRQEAGHR